MRSESLIHLNMPEINTKKILYHEDQTIIQCDNNKILKYKFQISNIIRRTFLFSLKKY